MLSTFTIADAEATDRHRRELLAGAARDRLAREPSPPTAPLVTLGEVLIRLPLLFGFAALLREL